MPVPDHPHSKQFPPNTQSKSSLFQLKTISPGPVTAEVFFGEAFQKSVCVCLHTLAQQLTLRSISICLIVICAVFIDKCPKEHCLPQFKPDISCVAIPIQEKCFSFPTGSLHQPTFQNHIFLHFSSTSLPHPSSQPYSVLHLQPLQAVTFLNPFCTSEFPRCFPSSSTPGQDLLAAGL